MQARDTSKIITVTGEVTPAELGFCQSHEHLFIAPGPASEHDPSLRIDDPERTAVDVCAYKAAGGSALVDAQPVFTGRNAEALRALSVRCGVNVIAATGFHKLLYYGDEGLLAKEAYALLKEEETYNQLKEEETHNQLKEEEAHNQFKEEEAHNQLKKEETCNQLKEEETHNQLREAGTYNQLKEEEAH
ncbi:MAG: hypothetical protein LBT52_04405, partial [Clostridiales Family XIII bacterium]|nr:hypothetical protein [Clostridiales Family XIII bacterium]